MDLAEVMGLTTASLRSYSESLYSRGQTVARVKQGVVVHHPAVKPIPSM